VERTLGISHLAMKACWPVFCSPCELYGGSLVHDSSYRELDGVAADQF
jgi:hypothetical protein